jgi:hypothetical protein
MPSTQISRILQIFVTTVMTWYWIANGISLCPDMVKNTCDGIRGKVKQLAALAQAFKVHWKGRSCQ